MTPRKVKWPDFGDVPDVCSARRKESMPLSEFPDHYQRHLASLVAADNPPPRYMYFGPSDAPRPAMAMESRGWLEWHWQRGIDPDKKPNRLPPKLRMAVIDRDGLVCGICGQDVEPDDIHIDHVIPRTRGGLTELGNLQVAHSRCNILKGAS